jgi:hypothetical protein
MPGCTLPIKPQSLQLHEHLADVLAGEELQESGRRLLDSMFHCLPKGDFAALEPLVYLLDERGAIAQVIRDEESLKKQTLFDGHQQISRACAFAVAGDRAAQGKTCEVACTLNELPDPWQVHSSLRRVPDFLLRFVDKVAYWSGVQRPIVKRLVDVPGNLPRALCPSVSGDKRISRLG